MYLGVDVVFGEISRLGGPAISVGEGSKTFQSLGHYTSKPLLSGQLRYEEHVLGSIDLIRTVCASCRTVVCIREWVGVKECR